MVGASTQESRRSSAHANDAGADDIQYQWGTSTACHATGSVSAPLGGRLFEELGNKCNPPRVGRP